MPQLLPPVEHSSFADIMEPDEDEEDLDIEGEVPARELGIEDDPDDEEDQRNLADRFAGNAKRLEKFTFWFRFKSIPSLG